jgi:hypothetical protein
VGQLGLVDRVVYELRGDSLALSQAATLDVLDPGERAGVQHARQLETALRALDPDEGAAAKREPVNAQRLLTTRAGDSSFVRSEGRSGL